MPLKRGRPISAESSDLALKRRRAQTRERMRQLRLRQQGESDRIPARTTTQLEQGEQIIDLTTSAEENAAATLLQLGLRVQNLTLPQDCAEAALQQNATDADENYDIYQEHRGCSKESAGLFRSFAEQPVQDPNLTQQGQAPLARYFQSLPARSNPYSVAGIERRVSSPTCNSTQPNTSELNSTYTQPGVLNNNSLVEDARVGNTEELLCWQQERQERREEDLVGDITGEVGQDWSAIPPGTEQSDGLMGSEDFLGREQLYGPEYNRSDSNSESNIGFVSEHLSSDIEDSEVNVTALDFVVQKLYSELVQGFHGCTEEEHLEKRRRHFIDAGDNHHGLGEMFNDETFPSVLNLKGLITSERLARERTATPEQWKSMFCGIPTHGQQRYPINLCLHEEQTRASDADIAFDIDSFLGFATSLAFAKKGLWSQILPQTKQNIASDIHIRDHVFMPNEDTGRPDHARLAMLKHIPHFMLGRVEGAHDITVFVLFPHLPVVGDKFRSLKHEQLARWMDQIYLPIIHRFYEAHYTQHIPASFQTAFDNSRAHSVEMRQVQGKGYEATRAIGYHLQPEYLGDVWKEILQRTISVPGLADFRDPQIFFSSKGTKLQFKSHGTRSRLADTMQHFQSFLEDCLDLGFVETERLYIDVGKEICPQSSLVGRQERHVDEEAQVYAWKRCCLEKYMKWMYDELPPSSKGEGQRYYTQNMLYDMGCLTSVTPKKSKHREGGLIYSQFYNTAKEIYDANKCFPFANDAMEELALDPHIRNATRNILGGGRRDAKTVEVGYVASKQRTQHALRGARQKSYGIREEHRITWTVFQGIQDRLGIEEIEESAVLLDDCPSYAWAVKTEVFVDFLWRSIDKFATGFEVVRARSRSDFTTWEQTKMMAMFLRCLRYVCGGHLIQQEGALWHGKREGTVGEARRARLWYGLGFKNTLPTYKYCWLEPRIDWNGLQFKSEVTDNVLFGNRTLQGEYLRRGRQARGFFDLSRQLELALDWIGSYQDNRRVCDRLVSWMVHICLKQFRVDVMSAVKGEIKAEEQEEALKGGLGLCYEYIDNIMARGCYLMSGNKTEFKQVSKLGNFLFDLDDGLVREHWEDRPFRVLYRRARTGIRIQNRQYRRLFQTRLWQWLYRYHWVLPYPCGNALLQTTKDGRRMWYSIQRDVDETEGIETWGWARKGWQEGRPREMPEWMEWNKEEWLEWVERGGKGEGEGRVREEREGREGGEGGEGRERGEGEGGERVRGEGGERGEGEGGEEVEGEGGERVEGEVGDVQG